MTIREFGHGLGVAWSQAATEIGSTIAAIGDQSAWWLIPAGILVIWWVAIWVLSALANPF